MRRAPGSALRRGLVIALVALAVGGLAGCGDDDDASTSTADQATSDSADLDAVTQELVDAGATQEVAACEAELLLQRVSEGDLTQDELQAWLDGEAEVGPVQSAVVEIEQSGDCANADANA
ncbi:MAG: hypothetical protein IPM45_11835 [Acidimicrobiales bacterium]|nr:hypothetical protein [Acidimicrobiales bacterium]